MLDGYDLGIGVLYPSIAKDEHEKALCRRAVGPLWDGKEVWLVGVGVALFAAFPPAFETALSAFFPLIVTVLCCMVLRVVACALRERDKGPAPLWDALFFAGSLVPAILLGVMVGDIYVGVPLNEAGDYIGTPLLGLATPFTLLCGALGFTMMLTAGSSWLALKAPKHADLRQRAQRYRRMLLVIDVVIFGCISLYGHFLIQPDMDPALSILRFTCAGGFLICMLACYMLGREDHNDLLVFFTQALSEILLVFLCAFTMFPNLVVAAAGSAGPSVGIARAVSPDAALATMLAVAIIGILLVIVCHVFVYRAFRGRLADQEVDALV